ncbi:MAG: hypothetical protein IPM84_26090 [Anaerolineae bacterium]|nr:hypothetical protein [Anaerolineae bacterium]
MTRVERIASSRKTSPTKFIGSLLSGGGGSPSPNTPAAWYDMVALVSGACAANTLGIPLIYGADACMVTTTWPAHHFPHNIGLGLA